MSMNGGKGKGERVTRSETFCSNLYPLPITLSPVPTTSELLLALRDDLLPGGVAPKLIDDGANGWRKSSIRG